MPSGDELLKRIEKNRRPILLSEIGALLHDLGKLSREFFALNAPRSKQISFEHHLILRRASEGFYTSALSSQDIDNVTRFVRTRVWNWKSQVSGGQEWQIRKQAKDAIHQGLPRQFPNLYQTDAGAVRLVRDEAYIDDDFLPEKFVDHLNQLPADLPDPLSAVQLGDFIEQHHSLHGGQPGRPIELLRARPGCDGVDSGVDKGNVEEGGKRQDLQHTYIATAFGYEPPTRPQRIELDTLGKVRGDLARTIDKELSKLLAKPPTATVDQVRREILPAINKTYRQALGETRRAANDVTLWDHSYSVASLYKAALAKMLIEEKWTEPACLNWRFLRVNLDILRLLSKAHRVGDLLGYREATTKALDQVKELVEVTYPLGNEVYRDETGVYFLFPDLNPPFLKELLPILKAEIEEEVRSVEKELYPIVAVSPISDTHDRKHRNLLIMADEVQQAERDLGRPLRRTEVPWQVEWERPSSSDRPAYYRYLQDQIRCEKVCFPERQNVEPTCNRASTCLVNAKDSQASGLYVPSVDVCPICGLRPKCERQELCRDCFKRREGRVDPWLEEEPQGTIWIDEVADHNGRVALLVGQFDLSRWLSGEFIGTMLTATDYKPGGGGTNTDGRKPKHPSPARLRRIWGTTQAFWEQTVLGLLEDWDYAQGTERSELRSQRLVLKVAPEKDFQSLAYEARVGRTPLSVYWDGRDRQFIVIDNLQRLAGALQAETLTELGEQLQGQTLELTLEEGGVRSCPIETAAEAPSNLQEYRPYIKLLASPVSFLALVPAWEAVDLAQAIKAQYEIQFSKVQDRLPMNLNLLFFPRRVPLYAAMEAARRSLTLHKSGEFERWTVRSRQDKGLFTCLDLSQDGKEHHLCVDTVLGDRNPKNRDVFYPNFILAAVGMGTTPLNQRRSHFQANGHDLVHVTELEEGDVVEIAPSYFDFEFLEAAARRFDMRLKDAGHRPHPLFPDGDGPRPYPLDALDEMAPLWELLGRRLKTDTQLHKFEGLLANRLIEWGREDEAFRQLVDSAISEFCGLMVDDEEYQVLQEAIVSGLLFDTIELYSRILKRKIVEQIPEGG